MKGSIMSKFLILISIFVVLGGCAMRGKEIPGNDATGSDAMKASPCACAQINHNAPGFTWLG